MNVKFTDFPGTHPYALSPKQTLRFKTAELVWAAMSVGKGHIADMKVHGTFSRMERRFRSYLLQAHLRVDASGAVYRSSLYDGLDPSEKSAVSYLIGMAITKLLFWRYFGVRWLMHLDIFRANFSVEVSAGQRPDLFGPDDLGNWYVAESKGRSGGRSDTALKNAKGQSRKVSAISGSAPHLCAAVMTYYSSKGLRAEVADPDPDQRGLEVAVEPGRFRFEYYQPLLELVDTAPAEIRGHRNRADVRYETAFLEDSGVLVGYDARVRSWMQAMPDSLGWLQQLDEQRRLDEQSRVAMLDDPEGLSFVGPDGVLIELDSRWSFAELLKEPQSRLASS